MEPFSFGLIPFVTIWWLTVSPASSSQYQDMVCENLRTSRNGRKMTEPGPECDLSDRNWCSVKTANYPEDKIMEIILDNRGIMKRLFGDNREARFLENSFGNQVDEAPSRPPPRYRPKVKKSGTTADNSAKEKTPGDSEDIMKKVKFPDSDEVHNQRLLPSLDEFQNGRFPASDILASVRHEFEEIFDEVTNITESPEVVEAVKSFEATTEITAEAETLKQEDIVESRMEPPPVVESNKIVVATTTAYPLDSGDDLRYTQPIPLTAAKTEKPSSASNSFRSGLPPRSRPRPELRRKPPPKEVLEARVEPPNRFSQVQNNQGSRYDNPTSSVAQSFLRQPSQPSKRDPPILDKPSLLLDERPSSGGAYHMEKFPACNSTSEVIAPTWAKSIQGKNLIVVNVGSFMQHLHVEECDKASLYRKMYCQRGCRCEQQYRLQKLLVIDPDDECRGIFSDWFRFPSCCVCVCYPSSMSRGGRSFNNDFNEEEFWEDDEYLDDPFVSHYYGLDDDFEDNFANDEDDNADARASSRTFEDELQASASSQTYTSFTDIDSIDQSFNREIPEKFQEENRKLSSKIGNQLESASANNSLHYMEATKEKKSRLLGGFPTNRTVNIRPQMAPRRTPPTRIAVPPYAFSWGPRSPSVNLWPALASYNQLPQGHYIANPSPNQYSLSNFADTVWGATPSPTVARDVATLGTLNAATQPYYKWNRRPRTLEGFEALIDNAENQPSFSRIPR